MTSDSDSKLRSNVAVASNDVDTLPATRSFAILTCMDARIDMAKLRTLREGEAQIVRNAGGRASEDAIRSLVMAYKVLGARDWFIVHHSHCGMALLSDETSSSLLASEIRVPKSSEIRKNGSQSSTTIDWQTIHDRQHGLVADIRRIRNHPLFPAGVALHGYLYHVESGRLVEVPPTGPSTHDSRGADLAVACAAG
jgi:carbonic anhydrase